MLINKRFEAFKMAVLGWPTAVCFAAPLIATLGLHDYGDAGRHRCLMLLPVLPLLVA